jgi:hypothetical protein
VGRDERGDERRWGSPKSGGSASASDRPASRLNLPECRRSAARITRQRRPLQKYETARHHVRGPLELDAVTNSYPPPEKREAAHPLSQRARRPPVAILNFLRDAIGARFPKA